jgi:hypothetical protein
MTTTVLHVEDSSPALDVSDPDAMQLVTELSSALLAHPVRFV